jgi:hypothetical protein
VTEERSRLTDGEDGQEVDILEDADEDVESSVEATSVEHVDYCDGRVSQSAD